MIIPIGKRVLVEHGKEAETKGGLIIPQDADRRPISSGVAVEVGSTKLVVKGDMVYFKKYAIDEIEYEGKKYSIIKSKDILAVEK